MIRNAKFEVEYLEDRNAPGSILDGFTPLAMWGTDLPLLNALNASSHSAVGVSAEIRDLTLAPLEQANPVKTIGNELAVVNTTAAPGQGGDLADVLGAVTRLRLSGPGITGPTAIRAGFDTDTLQTCDDCVAASGSDIGFDVTLGAVAFNSLFVYSNGFLSNNGNINTGSIGVTVPLAEVTGPANTILIAAFFADVDLRGSGTVTYGMGEADGYQAWGVTYRDVGYYDSHTDLLNTFQFVLINNTDLGVVQLEYNFASVQWMAGDFGPNVYGRVGWSDLQGTAAEVNASGTPDGLLDSNPDTGLINYDDGFGVGASGVLGRHVV